MSLAYILRRVQASAGMDSPNLNPEQRALLVDFVNEAAEELYEGRDLPGVLQEVYTNVSHDLRIALPAFVGEIKACRNRKWNGLVTLANIRARYTQEDWTQRWNKQRIIGYSAIVNDITNAAPLRYTYPIADPTVEVTVSGVTSNSNRAVETVPMTSGIMNGTLNFIEITKIVKNKVTPFNLLINDVNSVELALIYADQLESKYIIADVSSYPNIECCDNHYIMEVLFKPKLPRLENDTDEFPVPGYDNVIVLRTKQLINEEDTTKAQTALLQNAKSEKILTNKVQDREGTQQAKMTFKKNAMYGMFPTSNYRFRWPWNSPLQ